ncbi:bis(5'-nucleosyl)-tetraphosphatase (symmetrical) YqeK [Anaerosinus sp.]|uniref:bis(5'-nucleosyl)-tetraphosphatase (symmetrical) YqeK n=1 Tax=Selenobaculum sp. TaxID=3074374 RepID=UPI003AB56181
MEFNELKKILMTKLTNKRYQHSLGVADTAALLAKRFGCCIEKAKIAGLMHDCARAFSNEELLLMANDLEIRVGAIERKLPVLLHAYVGAMIIEKTYGIFDVEIQQAIRNHTTGGKSMGLLDKIIYLADVIEPSRNFSGVEKLRELAKQDLDVAVLAALDQSIIHIIMQKGLVHPDTIFARNELLLKDEYMDG